jgi:hypothetical protein
MLPWCPFQRRRRRRAARLCDGARLGALDPHELHYFGLDVRIVLWSTLEGQNDGFENAIGSFFQVKFPSDWPDDDKYDFDWNAEKLIRSIKSRSLNRRSRSSLKKSSPMSFTVWSSRKAKLAKQLVCPGSEPEER